MQQLDADVYTIPKSFKRRSNCDNIRLKKRLNVNSAHLCSISQPEEKCFCQKSGPRVAKVCQFP